MTTTDDGLRAIEKLKLWFFRDLSDEQRWKLFRLNEIPAEGNETHAVQTRMLKHVLAALRSSPAVDGVAVSAQSLLAIRDALLDNNLNEAWHQLYAIADPKFCEMEPWRNLEHKAARSALSTTSDRASVDAVDVLRELARNETNDFDAKALRYAANRLNSFDALKAEAALSPRSS